MPTLANLLSNLTIGDPMMWIALASGLAVILLFLFLARRQPRTGGPVVPPAPDLMSQLQPPTAQARHDERRRAIRRAGMPTPVLVLDPRARKAKPVEAYVLDRSTGGLRLAVAAPQPVGTQLKAKPSNAPDTFDWVTMVVRNCKETGDYFEIGCQFDTELELSRLLMFG